MESYKNILRKLSSFITKYYKTQMIKGAFMFVALAFLFWAVVLTLEYFLWLEREARMVVFILAIAGTLFLLIRYIGLPLMYLLRIRRGIQLNHAAEIIGKHFPQVGDRLINLLELAEDKTKTELLLASIEQRSRQLSAVPFQQAIDLNKSLRYAKYLSIPLLLFAGIWISGKLGEYINSLDRVIHYDMAFEKPAPFRFLLLNNDLRTIERQDFRVNVSIEGEERPDRAYIVLEGKPRLLQEDNGSYFFVFKMPEEKLDFHFTANNVKSRTYTLETIAAPSIQEFVCILDYPDYISKDKDTLLGTGNAIVPYGTQIRWHIKSQNTEEVELATKDSIYRFEGEQDVFKFERVLYTDLSYEVTTSNSFLDSYERLAYKISVIKDAYPTLTIRENRDLLNDITQYEGRASDDYKLTKLNLFYYSEGNEKDPKQIELDRPNEKDYIFYYDFPTGLELQPGLTYNYFFQVTDNDVLNQGKSARSRVFSTNILNEQQEIEQQLKEQQQVIEKFDKSLDDIEKQEELLKELEETQKQKNVLDYNDQKAIKDFLKSQQQQEALMEKFSKQLQETINGKDENTEIDRLLKERLQRQEMEAKKNERLLEQLRELADKIDKEEMAKKLEELGKRQQNSKRNLSQLLELTKRYYVTEKANELSRKLLNLAEKEETLSKIDQDQDINAKEQEKINANFEDISKELEELRKANEDLKKPMAIDTDKNKEAEVKEDLNEALEEIRKGENTEQADQKKDNEGDNKSKAKTKQRQAATKMRQLGEALQQSAMSGGGSTMAEDAEMLRQILDNLIVFSFKQETLLDKLNESEQGRSYFTNVVKEEQQLKNLFEHVDDSLFALSLRQAEITEFVNEQITEVYYNIDRSLESLAEGQSYQGASYQQYVLTAANNLADFLANVLSNMQQSLSQGQGGGQQQDGFQLPDIIKQQQSIQDSMGAMKEGEKGEKGNKGEEGKEKDGGKEGDEGKMGEQKEGLEGEEDMGELYEIYKQQQLIRNRLEDQLKNMINDEERGLAERLARQMEDFERDLIENGLTQRTMDRANRIQQQLMKLENAEMEQGEKEERESSRSEDMFDRPLIKKRSDILSEEGVIEELQRQVLPLQEFYREIAKKYFRADD